jgi:hypothetical protein
MKRVLLSAMALLLCISIVQAQETEEKKSIDQKDEKVVIKAKDDPKPDIYVDGKKFDFPLELIDTDIIESISVFKGEKALTEFNAPNGVVFIKTKIEIDTVSSKIEINNNIDDKAPLIIIDGNVADMESLKKISPDNIDNINVVKGEQAIEEYSAPNGVIIVTTKKEKSKEKKQK